MIMRRFAQLAPWLPLLAAGCTGSIGDLDGAETLPTGSSPDVGGAEGAAGAAASAGSAAQGPPAGPTAGPAAAGSAGNASVSFTCDPRAVPPPQGWRRLSQTEYRNTLRDLLALALGDATAATALLAQLPLAGLPDETTLLHGKFTRMIQDVYQDQVRVLYQTALAAGRALAAPERIGTALGACAKDGVAANDGDCLAEFVRRFGERALRRPLAPEEVAFFTGFHGGTPGVEPAGVTDVIAGLLMAPQFLYHVEHGEAPVAGRDRVFTLTAFELASRLSYQFWETMPDQALWEAARSGALKTPQGYAREVERLFADARARKVVETFYRQWLRVDEVPALDTQNQEPLFRAFAGAELPTGRLRAAVVDEVTDMVGHFTWTKAGGIDDLLTTPLLFPRTAELARTYGVPAWQPGGEPPALAGGARPGLLTRAAFLVSGSANTRPIVKGAFIRTGLLCDELPPPPDDAPPPPELSDRMTTRQQMETLTEARGSSCAACHATLINPLGFATEGFDALGRARSEQRLFSKTGKEVGRAPVNTSSVPQVVPGDLRPSSGPADLAQLLTESGRVPACLARNYFRFTYGRKEDPEIDGCALEPIRKAFTGNGSLRAALRDVALAPEFQQRRF